MKVKLALAGGLPVGLIIVCSITYVKCAEYSPSPGTRDNMPKATKQATSENENQRLDI